MNSTQPTPDVHADAEPLSAAEESKLDAAMRKADQILVASLQADDRRRRSRRWLLLTFGGLIMIAAGVVIVLSLLAGGDNPPPQSQSTTKPSGNANALMQEGWKLWQTQNYADAQEKFDQATQINPKLVNAWNGLGWARFTSGKSDEAEQAFKKCLELSPKHPAALNGMGQINYVRGNLDEAEKYLKLAAANNAPAAWWGLAKIYLLQGKWEDAEKWSQKIVDSGDKSGQELLDAAKDRNLPDDLRATIAPQTKEEPKPAGGL
jgi:tetratricopeptide (TPR) repeat protein